MNKTAECPDTVDPRYMVEIQLAFEDQCSIGWDNFARGLISKRWRHLQHCYLIRNDNKDMYAVDKWTRMVIKNILEYNRLLWKERCDILHNETNCTYQDRKRQEIFNLCSYLRIHKHLIPDNDHHFLDKNASFFFRSPIESVLNWEKRIIIGLTPCVKEKRTRDIRSYMIEVVTNNSQKIISKSNPASKPSLKNTIQTGLDSFIKRPNSMLSTNIHPIQPATKKQKTIHKTQTLLQLDLPTPPLSHSINSEEAIHQRDCRQISRQRESVSRFKRCRLTSPDPTPTIRTTRLVTAARTRKRRKITDFNKDPLPSYRT